MRLQPLLLALALLVVGCISAERPKQIDSASFLAPPPPGGSRDSALTHPNVQQGRMEMRPSNVPQVRDATEVISDVVAETIRPVGETSATAPALPTTMQAGRSSGQYLTIGGVMCEVNSKPIFADKVVALAQRDLMSKAQSMDEPAFRQYAANKLNDEAMVLIHDEVEFAAAEKDLNAQEKQMATILTEQWRQRKITEAGGSLEMARRKSLADGYTLEERADREFRVIMRQIYYQKKVMPRIQVRADDMREYYRANLAKEFTERTAARFRLIKITEEATGGPGSASDKIIGIYQRAQRGEPFDKLAAAHNDDPRLMQSGGDVGLIDKGAFREQKIEDEVWRLNVGEVTPPMKIGTAWYIAKLEEKKSGRVQPFEEQAVQVKIRTAMTRQQLLAMRDGITAHLRRQSVVVPDPPSITAAMEMVMQMYPRWKGTVSPNGPAPMTNQ